MMMNKMNLVAVILCMGAASAFVPHPVALFPPVKMTSENPITSQMSGNTAVFLEVPKSTNSNMASSAMPASGASSSSSSTKLDAVSTLEDAEQKPNYLPSGIFLASAAALGKLFMDIQATEFTMTPGIWALLLTTLAVGYDNFIIGLGKPFFSDVGSNPQKYNLLKALSYPRFTAHAVFVPFLYCTAAEIGQVTGVGWLQSDTVQTLVLAAAAVLGVVSRVNFVNSPGIDLADTSDSPADAWERQLIWFTYKEVSFLYIIPAIVLALLNLVVGIAAYRVGDDPAASAWLIASAVAVLYGNSKPSYVTRFTGNLAEVVMLWCIYESALLTMT